jgi:uncharacterized protein (DUF2062 family)
MFERLRRLMPTREAMAHNRWLRWIGPALMHPRVWHLSRRGVALGAAVGVFFAFITPIAQIPLSAGVSVLLRCNVPAALVATLVNTPATFGPVYYGAWKVGSWVLDEPVDAANAPTLLTPTAAPAPGAQAAHDPRPWWQRWRDTLAEIGKPLLVGTVIFSVVFSGLAYLLVSGVWHGRVRLRRRRRLRDRANASANANAKT